MAGLWSSLMADHFDVGMMVDFTIRGFDGARKGKYVVSATIDALNDADGTADLIIGTGSSQFFATSVPMFMLREQGFFQQEDAGTIDD